MRYFFVILFLILSTGNFFKSFAKERLFFEHITIEDGLSQSTIKVIMKDSQGFMWFGTENGLNKFDGYDFTIYNRSYTNKHSISGNRITCILEDDDGSIWVGTSLNGVNRLNKEKDTFERFEHDDDNPKSISSNSISCLLKDDNGNIWVGTLGGGLNLFNRSNQSFKHFVHMPGTNSLANNYISSINQDKTGKLWLANNSGNLTSLDIEKNDFSNYYYQCDFKGQVNSEIFGNSIIDSKQRIWIGTEKGVFVFDINSETFTSFAVGDKPPTINNNAVTGIYENDDGIYWITTDHGGMNIYNENNHTFQYELSNKFDAKSLINNQIYCIYKDDEENYWIGSYNGGINVCYTHKYKFDFHIPEIDNPNSLNYSSVVSIIEDKKGKIWLGTDGGGVNSFDQETKAYKLYMHEPGNKNSLSSNVAICLHEDRYSNIWVGTYLKGLNMLNQKTGLVKRYANEANNPMSLNHNNIWDIAEDENNVFWIGSKGGGVNLFKPKTGVIKKFVYNENSENSITDNDIQCIYIDSDNDVWIGASSGLSRIGINSNEVKQFKLVLDDESERMSSRVVDIVEDKNKNIWIGSIAGLYCYSKKQKTLRNINKDHGIGGTLVKTLVVDHNNDLWIGTNAGLSKYSKDLNRIVNFDTSDGLPSNEFNYNAGCVSKSGKLYLGTLNGFISFYPDSIKFNQLVPKIVITDLLVLNKSVKIGEQNSPLKKHINVCDTIWLTHNQSVFTLKYAALSYLSPVKNQYAYMLEGFDKDWNYVGNERKVTYTNLDPGTYTFKVKGTNNDGVWNLEGTSVTIVVAPPWYETWLFRILLFLIICLLLYMFYLYKIRSVDKQKEFLKHEVRNRTRELYESNSQLEEMNQEMHQQREQLIKQAEILANTNKKLESSSNELGQHKYHLEELVKKRTAELEKSKLKAEESDRLKTAFLANMSHEIRTPMNAIVGFANLIKQKNLTDKQREDYVVQVISNTKSLLILIDDILDLSMMESNLLNIQKKDFELNMLIDEVYLDGNLRNTVLDLRLNNKCENLNLTLFSDRYRIKQILTNFFNNACKFTETGYVELGCYSNDSQLVVYVEDSGMGISDENIKLIFNRFVKITDDKTKLFRGAGLGLAISNKITDVLGGELKVESELGKGSRFSLYLPSDVIVKRAIEQKHEEEAIEYNWKGKKVLIVEDEEDNFLYLKSALKPTHISIEWAKNGQIAVDYFDKGNTCNLVLMDIKMPVLNGFDATIMLKEKYPEQVIIAQTAYARSEDFMEIKKAGFNDYLIKPIVPDDLYKVLNEYFV